MEKSFFTKSPDKQCHNAASEKRKKQVAGYQKNRKTKKPRVMNNASHPSRLPQKQPQTAVLFSVAGPSSRMRMKSSIIEFFSMHRHAS
jgi:phage protein D